MTRILFSSWFHNEFVPSVKKHAEENEYEPKALLLVDNCSAHHMNNELESEDGMIKVAFLPPNVTALGQPMDQGVINSLKVKYKRKLLNFIVLECSSSIKYDDRMKQVTLLKTIEWVAQAWEEVGEKDPSQFSLFSFSFHPFQIPHTTIERSWNKIFEGAQDSQDGECEDMAAILKIV